MAQDEGLEQIPGDHEGMPASEPAPTPTPAFAVAEPYAPTPAPAQARSTGRRGLGVLGTVLVAAVVAAVVGTFAGLSGYVIGRSVDGGAPVAAAESEAVALPEDEDSGTGASLLRGTGAVARIAKATLPAVVSVVVGDEESGGSGSGFVVRPNGYIVTNNHVVAVATGKDDISVVFNDGSSIPAKVVGTSTNYDIALLKVDMKNLATLALGDSSNVSVGDEVVAIGAPLGLDGTVTSGIISALDRPVTAGEDVDDLSYINAIQTDAAINPGNSGGPLIDASGQVIGVNSAIATMSAGEAGSIGLGFAIPSNSVKRIAEELITTGKSSTPIMGVTLDTNFDGPGAKVLTVGSGSGADLAGIKKNDLIVALDGRAISDATELVVAVRDYAPGDAVSIEYERDGSVVETRLVLGDDSDAN